MEILETEHLREQFNNKLLEQIRDQDQIDYPDQRVSLQLITNGELFNETLVQQEITIYRNW